LSNAFIAAMGDRGYGSRNLVVDIRYTQGNPDLAESLARELVTERVDVIVTGVTATAMAARRATKDVPIVMYISGYPVEGGLADSLAKPGGNVTGMTLYAGGGVLFGKFVQLLRELRPSLRELGVFWGYAPPSYRLAQVAPATEELRQAARALNINVHFWQTGTDSDVSAALSAAASAPLDGMFVTEWLPAGVAVLAIFGMRPDRPGFSAVGLEGRADTDDAGVNEIEIAAAREDGSPPFGPTLAGGSAAGLHSIANPGELLLLTCRLLSLLPLDPTPDPPGIPSAMEHVVQVE
jgi:hypothetical protein